MPCNHGDPNNKCDGFFCDCACHQERKVMYVSAIRGHAKPEMKIRGKTFPPTEAELYYTPARIAWWVVVFIVAMVFIFGRCSFLV